jgi:hypothetical protein
MGSIHPRAT